MRKKSGFTLIELMVVVVLVMILALAIVPTFKEIINKAKYTEGSSAISALRTKIKVYYVEHNVLPGLAASFDGVNGCSPITNSVNVDNVDSSDDMVQRLTSSESSWWLVDADDVSNLQIYTNSTLSLTGKGPLQKDLNIGFDAYAGAYFNNEDYQYMIINAGKDDPDGDDAEGVAYAIAVTAGAGSRNPDIGTSYAVMDINNPNWDLNKQVILTWDRFAAEQKNRLYLQLVDTAGSNSDLDFAIPVPSWDILTTDGVYQQGANATTNLTLNFSELKDDCGWVR